MAKISLEKLGSVAVLTLTRPEARNAVDRAMMDEIRLALQEIEEDANIRVAILTGEGSVFCAGMDLAGFVTGDQPGIMDTDRFAGFVGVTRSTPFIAAVNGPALAGGMELVLACELALAVPTARFALPEVQLGLIAAGGGAVRLPQKIPPTIAAEMLLTGDPISAGRAAELCLINRIVPTEKLLEASLGMATKIAAASPTAVSATLSILAVAAKQAEEAGWRETDRLWANVAASCDAQVGTHAFLNKKRPIY